MIRSRVTFRFIFSLALALLLFGLSSVLAGNGVSDETKGIPTPSSTPYLVDTPSIPSPFAPVPLAPIVGPNLRCNSRVICSGGGGKVQSETALAIVGDAIICGYNDFRGFRCPTQDQGYQILGWSYSLDGGENFIDGGPLPGRTAHSGDPWLAVGPDNTIYFASIYQGLSRLAVMRGTVTGTGIDWSTPTLITDSGSFDKEALVVDPNTGHLYMSYTRFGGPGGIWLQKSTDGGMTFRAYPVASGGPQKQGSFPAIGPNGEVYVTWNIGWPSQTGIGFAKSTDGGQTFTPQRTVGTIGNFQIPGLNRPNPAFPQIAVDNSGGPNTGNVYIVWHTAHLRQNGDVVMIRSTDGGDTWSDPVIINDDTTTAIQFYPTISVDDYGQANVFFYDRRNNPGTAITDLYFAQSTDGGLSFNENVRVTDVSSVWTDPGDGAPNYGDYINSISIGDRACVAYADGRDGDPDAYYTCVLAAPVK